MGTAGGGRYEIYRLVKENVKIEDVISSYGISLVRTSHSSYKALCPFHNDTRESLTIQSDKQYFKCFSCGAGGTAIEFIMKMEQKDNPRFSFDDAVLKLKNDFNLPIDTSSYEKKIKSERYTINGNRYSKNAVMSIAVNENLNELFQSYLFVTKQGHKYMDYLFSRGLTLNSIKRFGIGFCPKGALESFYRSSDDSVKKSMIDAGLIDIRKGGRIIEYFSDRITFPLKDEKGNIVGYTARTLNPRDYAKYKNSKASSLFDKSRILYNFEQAKSEAVKDNRIIILEGNVDVVSACELGILNAVGLDGCSMSQERIRKICAMGIDVVLALDNDEAGHNGTLKLIEDFNKYNDSLDKSSRISVSCLDLDGIGNFKDFGDILKASLDDSQIKDNFDFKLSSAEKSPFEFRLKYDYFLNKAVTPTNIKKVYSEIENDMDSEKLVVFKNFCSQKSGYGFDTVGDIIEARNLEDNPYAQLGMAIINPYLENKKLDSDQKTLIVSKIIQNTDEYISQSGNIFSVDEKNIDRLIDSVKFEAESSRKNRALITEAEVFEKNPDFFSLDDVCKVHSLMYPESKSPGSLRTDDAGHAFCRPENIKKEFYRTVNYVNSIDSSLSKDEKCYCLSRVFKRILKIKMFDGEYGRIERKFMEQAGNKIGIEFDYGKISQKEYKEVCLHVLRTNDVSYAYDMFRKISVDKAKEISNQNSQDLRKGSGYQKPSSLREERLP